MMPAQASDQTQLLAAMAVDRLEAVEIFKKARAMEKASDHVPIVATLLD